MSAFPSVLSEGWIGSVRVPNRVVFPAVQMNYANPDGTVSEKLRDFYCRVAEGGCGLIVTGTAVVSADSLAFDRVMRVDKDEQGPRRGPLFFVVKKKRRGSGTPPPPFYPTAASQIFVSSIYNSVYTRFCNISLNNN